MSNVSYHGSATQSLELAFPGRDSLPSKVSRRGYICQRKWHDGLNERVFAGARDVLEVRVSALSVAGDLGHLQKIENGK